jgi:hypothetical protein
MECKADTNRAAGARACWQAGRRALCLKVLDYHRGGENDRVRGQRYGGGLVNQEADWSSAAHHACSMLRLSLFTFSSGDFYILFGVEMSSGSPNHQAFSCRFHDLTGDRVQRVDLHNACDLGDEAVEQAEIASGNANDCR